MQAFAATSLGLAPSNPLRFTTRRTLRFCVPLPRMAPWRFTEYMMMSLRARA